LSEKIKSLGENLNITKYVNSSNMFLRIIPALGRDEEEGFSPE